MGWSCAVNASEVMERIFEASRHSDGMIEWNGERYFLEPDTSKEYEDGRILMRVYKVIAANKSGGIAGYEGKFFIRPDGGIAQTALRRFPFLRNILQE